MASGRKNQLTKQVGEYLVACELARRGLLVATFSGNVPDFDIITADQNGNSVPIQVKTIHGGAWQFKITDFAEVKFEGKKQIVGSYIKTQIPQLIWVFVIAQEYGKDRFFILEWDEIQKIAVESYKKWLNTKGGIRPRNFETLHCAVTPENVKKHENKWEIITKKL